MVAALAFPPLAQAGASSEISWPWVIGIALVVITAGLLYFVLKAGRSLNRNVCLVSTKGLHAGERFTLTSAFATVGTEKDNDIVLSDEKISRHHARLRFHGARLEVTDLNTLYGTQINGQRIEKADCVHGDTLALGSVFECRVEIESR
jgi:hypothetical protein